jgi:hypothetical protein
MVKSNSMPSRFPKEFRCTLACERKRRCVTSLLHSLSTSFGMFMHMALTHALLGSGAYCRSSCLIRKLPGLCRYGVTSSEEDFNRELRGLYDA